VSGEVRLSALPQVPTFTESGIPGFEVRTWYGILAPSGTAEAIVEKISNEVARIVQLPDVREEFVAQGVESFVSTPEQFAAMMKADLARYARVIKAANIKIEQ